MITRKLSKAEIARRIESMNRRKKYLIVLPNGSVLSGVKYFPNYQTAFDRAEKENGILLSYTDTLPEGLNEWRVDVYGPTGELEQSMPSDITAKNLGHWWQSEGIKMFYRGELKGRKLKFYRGIEQEQRFYKQSDPPFTFPIPEPLMIE